MKNELIMTQAEQLIALAQSLVDEWPSFFEIKGHGAGDLDTGKFMRELRLRARTALDHDFAEQEICGNTKQSVDYYFPEEGTIIEIAMSLRNPNSEYERDLLKAIMAHEASHEIKRLIFLSKPGGLKTCSRPGHRAFAEWIERSYGIAIEIREFSPLADLIPDSPAEDET